MRFSLTAYQEDAALSVLDRIQEGIRKHGRSGRRTAVALTAPTGAGKTVIATAVIERLLHGGDGVDPDPDMTVLWVTDDPSLNVQTKRKMLVASSQLRPNQLVTVDPSLDQRVLDPGRVYFVHIQQLGKGATNYVKVGDRRKYSLWDTIATTIRESGDSFLLVVDEAHRGTADSGSGRTITARLIDGAGGDLPASPVVLGISATPQRFINAISSAGERSLEPVTISPDDVKDSGLIKDKIRIRHPSEPQPSDATLIELAVADLKSYDELWRDYSETQGEPPVNPALVIQVPPKVSNKDLARILETLSSAWGELDDKAVAHAFQEHAPLAVGDRTIRYVAPQDVQDDPRLRVVLFKEALTTGWDCPRAEVMVSLRNARDHTYIAQLIGRMVRTPLARRVTTNQVLNSVSLYLPFFDDAHVDMVVKGLRSDDANVTSTVEVDSVNWPKNPDVPAAAWACLEGLPTYTRPSKYHRNDVARLNALATLLVGSGLHEDATNVAQRHLTITLDREAVRLSETIDETVSELEEIQYATTIVDLASGASEVEVGGVPVNPRNINDLFRQTRRALGDAAAHWYWDYLCDTKKMDPDTAKLYVAALAQEPSVVDALNLGAKGLVDTWRNEYNTAISKLPDAMRAKFYSVWQQSKSPERVALLMPTQISASKRETPRPKHLYAKDGQFPVKLTTWEERVLERELASETLVGWYRNPTGGNAAIAVPYDHSGIARTMYPDFVFLHEVNGHIVADLVDPHRPDSSDTSPKWTGLGHFAEQHAKSFRRVAAVIQDDAGKLWSLDMKNPDARVAIASAATEPKVREVFKSLGGHY